ncbi:MAG: sulfotransferase [Bacteroidota bacterium]
MTLPNFIIIGERRSGTTNLAKWLEAHPEIFIAPQVDKGFFIDDEVNGRRIWLDGQVDTSKWEEDHNLKDYAAYFEDVTTEIAIGEKSADYLFWTPAHARIKKNLPDIKLLVILRNPIERAWSMYWNELGKGREDLSFEEAIVVEKERIAKSDYAKDHLSYISRGFYDESLAALFKVFNPEKVKVLVLEECIKNPIAQLKEVYQFLGVNEETGFQNVNKKVNANWTLLTRPFWKSNSVLESIERKAYRVILLFSKLVYRNNRFKNRKLAIFLARPFRYSKKDVQMKPKTREKLRKEYKASIKSLERLLGKDLSIWLKE